MPPYCHIEKSIKKIQFCSRIFRLISDILQSETCFSFFCQTKNRQCAIACFLLLSGKFPIETGTKFYSLEKHPSAGIDRKRLMPPADFDICFKNRYVFRINCVWHFGQVISIFPRPLGTLVRILQFGQRKNAYSFRCRIRFRKPVQLVFTRCFSWRYFVFSWLLL